MRGLHGTRYLIVKLVKFVMLKAKFMASKLILMSATKLMTKLNNL